MSSNLREKISAAAQELYLRDGIQGVSMRKVAELVGVSAPAIYRHFENKEALLTEITVEGLKILEGFLRPALEEPTPYERLRRLIDNYLEFTLQQPRYFDFAFLLPRNDIGTLEEEIQTRDWATFKLSLDQVSACMEEGVFRKDDPMQTGVTIWAAVHGLVTLYRTGRFGQGEELFREVYAQTVERVLAGLK
jgi:AcrR family transcriptional regulator